MIFIPEWAPNIHPVLIHFPIVLLLLGPLFDAGTILFKKQQWLAKNANLLYALAGLSILIVYISGQIAADSVDLPSSAYITMSTHANWALYTLILGGLNAILRGFQLFQKKEAGSFQWYMIVPGLVVAILLLFTADKGAKLVYAHGVGVATSQLEDHHTMKAEKNSPKSAAEQTHSEEISHESISRRPDVENENNFEWILGDAKSTNLEIAQGQNKSMFSLKLDSQEALFVLPEIYTNLEFMAKLNRDEFKGVVRLVHHVSNESNYDLLELSDSTVTQGRVKNGELITFDSGEVAAINWINLKVVGTKGHFRGYINQKLVTHGHGHDLPPGKIGVYAKGSGILKLSELTGTLLE